MFKTNTVSSLLLLAGIALSLGACSTSSRLPEYLPGLSGVGPGTSPRDHIEADGKTFWDASYVEGEPQIVIDLNQQLAYFYKGNTLVGRTRIATGKEGHDTPAGNYKIIELTPDKRSNLYGVFRNAEGHVIDNDVDIRKKKAPPGYFFEGSPMPYWMRLTTSGIGMHGGFIPEPGFSASHGCIRMPDEMAKHFHMEAKLGTPVRVIH